MLTLPRHTLVATFAAAALAAAPAAGQEDAEQCEAVVSPDRIEAGARAVRVTVSLSENIGLVTDLGAGEGSGIGVASPEDLPRTEMAAEGGAPRPIEMAAGENAWTFWLNTAEAEPGPHEFTVLAAGGECHGTITLTPGAVYTVGDRVGTVLETLDGRAVNP